MGTEKTTSLPRKLGIFSLTNIVVANMVGAGIFITSGLLMESLKNPIIMLSLWGFAGIIAICGALSYGELGAAIPKAGGEYIFISEIFHPLPGFLSGWTSFIVGFSAPIAASAMGFSEYFIRALPEIVTFGSEHFMLSEELLKKIFSILLILVFTFIHLRGIETSAKVQNWLTVLKVGLVGGLILIGFIFGKGNFNHFIQREDFIYNMDNWKTIGLSLMWIMFAYSGWNASTYIGSEIKNPKKSIPNSLLIGTGLVILLYMGLNAFFVYAIPPDKMMGVVSIGGLAVNFAFGKNTEVLLSLLISFALFSSLSAYLILGPRVSYSMAKRGFLFKQFGRVNPTTKVPSLAILLQSGISIIMVLSGTFDQILTFLGFSLGIFPILTVAGVFKMRIKKRNKIQLPGYPFAPAFFILSSLFILVLAFLERPKESILALITISTGIPFYYLIKWINEKKSLPS